MEREVTFCLNVATYCMTRKNITLLIAEKCSLFLSEAEAKIYPDFYHKITFRISSNRWMYQSLFSSLLLFLHWNSSFTRKLAISCPWLLSSNWFTHVAKHSKTLPRCSVFRLDHGSSQFQILSLHNYNILFDKWPTHDWSWWSRSSTYENKITNSILCYSLIRV